MNSTITQCVTHTPQTSAISTVYGMGVDIEYTFCTECEQNIERTYFYDDFDRLPFYSKWSVTK